jgi:xanthine dehydrogenase accessory factor
MRVVIIELPQPLAVRRSVSFSEAVYQGTTVIEDIKAQLVSSPEMCNSVLNQGEIPVVVDPVMRSLEIIRPIVLIDARMTKRPTHISLDVAPLIIGLGPGFEAGENCHAVIETKRGHTLGRVIWSGKPLEDTGIPEAVADHYAERVLRAPADGTLTTFTEIGDLLEEGQLIAKVDGFQIEAPFEGILRGILPSGMDVSTGLKIGDIDPRADPSYCYLVSDKSLAIGGAVLEAILSRPELRLNLWG